MLKSPNNHTGFTLIESTISVFILLVGLVAVIAFFPLGMQIVGDSHNVTFASNLAQSKIEELKQNTYDTLVTGTIEAKHRLSADTSDTLYDYQRQTTVETVDTNLNVSATDAGLKKITVVVYWLSPITNTEQSYTMSSLIADY